MISQTQYVLERVACPCCGYRRLSESGAYEVCRVCRWEDDGLVSTRRPDRYTDGPNGISLAEGQRNFRELGAAHPDEVGTARIPRADEARSPDWRDHTAG
jgi:hypothetical protein